MSSRNFHLAAEHNGLTLCAALKQLLPDQSWSQVRKLIDARRVQVSGNLCLDEQRKVKSGEVVKIVDHPLAPPVTVADVRLVYVDEHLVVVQKPAGVTTLRHREETDLPQRRKQLQLTLDELVRERLADHLGIQRRDNRRESEKRTRVRPVHRLDRDTSGLMVFARTPAAEQMLIRMFARHEVQRAYVAVIHGRVEAQTIDTWLVRDRGDGLRGSTPQGENAEAALRAVTHVRPMEHLDGYTVLECRLETGRTHQIRIHLSEIGHPLCGEKLYTHSPGEPPREDTSGAPRQALHAAELAFVHPIAGEALRFRMALPKELKAWLLRLKGEAQRVKTVFDVIVVGGGGSGLAAAVSASEHGCQVLVLEKQPRPGGTTGIAVGSFTANRTALQQSRGISDSLDSHAEDAGKFARPEIEARNNAALRRYFLGETAATFDWLLSMGLSFHGPNPEPPNRVPRMHNVVPGAREYIAALHSRLVQMGGEIHCDAAVESLIREGDRVCGVWATIGGTRLAFRAERGVVLAAGDYANSPEIIGQHKGQRFTQIEGINPKATGDGHRLAESMGAKLVNMDVTYGPEIRFVAPRQPRWRQWIPTPWVPKVIAKAVLKRLLVTWLHPENALFDDGAILVNRRGERFCDERISPEREISLASQPRKQGYILLDRRLIERYSKWPHFISTAPQIAYAYVDDYLRLRPDVAAAGNSLAALAKSRGLVASALEATVTSFNETAREPLAGNRWVLLGPAKAYFTTTEGGAAIDEQLRVLDENGRPIAGLYAVGQNGLGGQILFGHGLHIAWALTSGRLVGEFLGRGKLP